MKKLKKADIDRRKREIHRYIEKWRPRLFLGEWMFSSRLMVENKDGNPGLWAEAKCCPVYLRCDLMIYPHLWDEPKKQREEIIVHEMCHCITEEIYQASFNLLVNGQHVTPDHLNDMRERLTQRITNVAFDWD